MAFFIVSGDLSTVSG